MKRFFFAAVFGLGAVALGGCPIYSSSSHSDCYDDYHSSCYDDCGGGNCAPPDAGTFCSKPTDCGSGATCGSDNLCHADSCLSTGCPTGYQCTLASGTAVPVCTAVVGKPDAGSTAECSNDAQCSAKQAGAKCLSGKCVGAPNQCSDATQCAEGSQCVDGACTPSCDSTKPCPTGYACDTAKGVCTGNTTPCGAAASCSGSNVCVEERCVAPCGAGDKCAVGLTCVDGGCVADENPRFTCDADGPGGKCASGSICLRHSCYIGCSADGGADACRAADRFNECKQVTTSSSTFSVCGSATNLGSECDVAASKACASSKVCIDGYCR